MVVFKELPSFAFNKTEIFHSIFTKFSQDGRHHPIVFILSQIEYNLPINTNVIAQINADRINFNPFTTTKDVQVLKNIIRKETEENGASSTETSMSIAESSKGDMRAATNSFQFVCHKSGKP